MISGEMLETQRMRNQVENQVLETMIYNPCRQSWRPMALSSFCALQLARVQDRLGVLEDRLKRVQMQADERAARRTRELAAWSTSSARVH